MTFVQDDLGGYVLWGATKSPCFLSKSYFLCKAKIDLGEGAGEHQGRASEGMSAVGSAPLEVKQGRKEDSSWEFSPIKALRVTLGPGNYSDFLLIYPCENSHEGSKHQHQVFLGGWNFVSLTAQVVLFCFFNFKFKLTWASNGFKL